MLKNQSPLQLKVPGENLCFPLIRLKDPSWACKPASHNPRTLLHFKQEFGASGSDGTKQLVAADGTHCVVNQQISPSSGEGEGRRAFAVVWSGGKAPSKQEGPLYDMWTPHVLTMTLKAEQKRWVSQLQVSQSWLGVTWPGDLTKMDIVWLHHQTRWFKCLGMVPEDPDFKGIITKCIWGSRKPPRCGLEASQHF